MSMSYNPNQPSRENLMQKATRLHAFAVISCLSMGLVAFGQEPAPKPEAAPAPAADSIKVAAHQSRWDYPKEVTPPAGHSVHIVEKGDTLWDLGTKYLGNPFSWPQIWELNKWVKDPHWIYPGDPLIVDATRTAVPAGKESESAPYEVSSLKPDLRRIAKPTQEEYAYSFQDFIQMPFVVAQGATAYFKEKGGFLLNGHQDRTRGILSDGDNVYIDGGTKQGVKVGDRLVVTKVLAKYLYHPDDKRQRKSLGEVLQQEGIIRVTTVYADSSVAMIEHSLDGIFEGSYAVPYQEPAAIIAHLRTEVSSPVDLKEPLGKVIFLRDQRPVAGTGDMVIVDQGTRQGLKVGDILFAARRRQLDTGIMLSAKEEDTSKPMTNYYIGQMMVVATQENTCSCRLLRTREELFVGDIVSR